MNKRLPVRLDEKTYKTLQKKLIDLDITFQEFMLTKIKEFLKEKK